MKTLLQTKLKASAEKARNRIDQVLLDLQNSKAGQWAYDKADITGHVALSVLEKAKNVLANINAEKVREKIHDTGEVVRATFRTQDGHGGSDSPSNLKASRAKLKTKKAFPQRKKTSKKKTKASGRAASKVARKTKGS